MLHRLNTLGSVTLNCVFPTDNIYPLFGWVFLKQYSHVPCASYTKSCNEIHFEIY